MITAEESVPPPALSAEKITTGYKDRVVIDDLSVDIRAGAITVLIGPNGCGKSTLLKALARLQPINSGRILVDGEDIHRQRSRDVARRLAILPQAPIAPEGITVGDLVARGRHPHNRIGRRDTSADDAAVVEALLATGCGDLVARPVAGLSGGQRQRVWISMALAQQTPHLLLDEPTTYLDVAHQMEVMDLLTDLNRTRGTTVVLVSHDLNHAARYADVVIAMKDGRIRAGGAVADVITETNLRDVFGMTAHVGTHPVTGRPHVYPLGRHDV
ncbi:ABC transporter ATP-binding protein [Gordonia malaquae]|uniref:ABC transporter ATP-binding protein n=1 Tax=Gordonia malaquae TaxID=410332 RepID=UPI0030FEE92A